MNEVKISVVIPVLNEEKTIIPLLDSLQNQKYKANEIIICDGGSTDNTINLINKYNKYNSKIIITKERSLCRGSGRNIAIENSNNEIIAMIDAGTLADTNWLYNLVNKYKENNEIDVVYGVVKPIIKNSFDACVSTVIIGKYYKDNLLSPTVSSILIKKNIFFNVGQFPYNKKGKYVVEDLVFLNNIKNNEKIKKNYSSNAIVNWHLSKNYISLILRFISNSRGGVACGFFSSWHLKTIINLLIYFFLLFLSFFNIFFLLILFIFHTIRVFSYYKHHLKEYKKNYILKIINFLRISNVILAIDIATIIGLIFWLIFDRSKYINYEKK